MTIIVPAAQTAV